MPIAYCLFPVPYQGLPKCETEGCPYRIARDAAMIELYGESHEMGEARCCHECGQGKKDAHGAEGENRSFE